MSVDFAASSMRWVTKESGSHGAFTIESVLRITPADGDEIVFALGAAVLAGNMFVPAGLVKQPAYHFQVAASSREHVIYRTHLDGRLADTSASNDEVFASLDIHLASASARPISAYADIADHYRRRAGFSAIVALPLADGGRMELEFPIRHFTLLPSREMFQGETGPVLFAQSRRELMPACVHFNRLDRADVSLDFPFGRRSAQVRTLDCDIRLMAQ